jgi:hypothetical protein
MFGSGCGAGARNLAIFVALFVLLPLTLLLNWRLGAMLII